MNMPKRCLALLAAIAMASASAQTGSEDPYAFLENTADARSQAFYREQAAATRAALDAIPGRGEMLSRIRALSEAGTTITAIALAGARVFYLKRGPGQLTPVLCMREGVAGPEKVVLEPERFMRGDVRAAIDWYTPSPDGRHVAYGVSLGGSEDSVLRVLVVDTRRDLPLEIDRTRLSYDLSWHPDGHSFYYTRVPEGNEGAKRNANARVYRHVLGRETARDEVVFAAGVGGARDVPEFVYPSLHLPLESRYAFAIAREGVRREIAVHVAEQRDLANGKPRWHKLVRVEDEVLQVEGWKDDLFLLSKRGHPRHQVLRVKASASDMSSARPAVPQGDSVIQSFGIARDALYLRTMVGGVDRLERMSLGALGSRNAEFVRTPFDHSITQMVTHPRVDGAILRMQGWIEPPVVARIDRGGNLANTTIQPKAVADFSEMDEVRLYAPGHDGTKIPVTLIYRKSTRLGGDNPMLLTAYGSYGIPLRPSFDPVRLAWLERGGIYAVAHVRGGGEYGEAWHQAGRRETKINTILDMIAVAEFVSRYGFTNPRRLAIMGGSAGGIPVGGALVRRPELFAAVVARVPVMDMLRAEFGPNGPANIPEFGSVRTPAGLEALRVMSAYHQVKDGTPYPAVMLTAGMNDSRVDPWQPGKMAARLKAASTGGKPILLRVDTSAGHGIGSSRVQQDEELADIYSFLLWQFGEPQFQPPAPAMEVPAAPAVPPAPPAAVK